MKTTLIKTYLKSRNAYDRTKRVVVTRDSQSPHLGPHSHAYDLFYGDAVVPGPWIGDDFAEIGTDIEVAHQVAVHKYAHPDWEIPFDYPHHKE